MISAGERRERPMFQAPVKSQAAGEEQKDEFVDRFALWAKVESQEGSELQENRRMTAENTIRINVIASPQSLQITQEWRVVWNRKTWNVSSAIATEDRREVWIRAMEVKGAI